MRFVNTLVKYRQVLLATTVVSAIALPQIVSAFDGSDTGRIIVAQKEDPKKKKEPKRRRRRRRRRSRRTQVQPAAAAEGSRRRSRSRSRRRPQPKAPQPAEAGQAAAAEGAASQPGCQKQQSRSRHQPKSIRVQELKRSSRSRRSPPKPVQKQDTASRKSAPKQEPKTVQPQPKLAPEAGAEDRSSPSRSSLRSRSRRRLSRSSPKQAPEPDSRRRSEAGNRKWLPTKQPPVQQQTFGTPKEPPPAASVGNVNELKGKRQEERARKPVVIVEPGNRRIFREGNRLVIRHDEGERMRRWGNARFETRGSERYTIVNRGGYDVVTITDSRGHMLRRYRRFPDGREYGLIDNRRRLAVGAAVVGGVVLLGLAAPRILIPRDRYIVDAGQAPPTLLYETLDAPPEVPPERAYTLDEIRDNVELRDRVRSVDINTINFASGSWEVSPDQIPQLQALAEAMLKVISENPATVFMLEGHTDAVGSAEDNAIALRPPRRSGGGNPDHQLQHPAGEPGDAGLWRAAPARADRRTEPREPPGAGPQHHRADGRRDGQPGGPPDGPPGQPPG